GAYGGITANSAASSVATVQSTAGESAVIELTTPIEYYDLYDWFFGGCGAGGNATGTHPENMRVGHFLALEKAGLARPFNWYSYADIVITYNMSCGSGRAVIMSRSQSVKQGAQLSTPIQPPCTSFTQRNS